MKKEGGKWVLGACNFKAYFVVLQDGWTNNLWIYFEYTHFMPPLLSANFTKLCIAAWNLAWKVDSNKELISLMIASVSIERKNKWWGWIPFKIAHKKMSVSVETELFLFIRGILSDQQQWWHLNVSFFSPLLSSKKWSQFQTNSSSHFFLPYFFLTKPIGTKGIFPSENLQSISRIFASQKMHPEEIC